MEIFLVFLVALFLGWRDLYYYLVPSRLKSKLEPWWDNNWAWVMMIVLAIAGITLATHMIVTS